MDTLKYFAMAIKLERFGSRKRFYLCYIRAQKNCKRVYTFIDKKIN